MKKVLALVIAAMLVISMFPVMALTTSAVDMEGIWTTYRRPNDYEEPEEGEELAYCPAPGYDYTSEGFQTRDDVNFTNTTPFFTIQTKDKVNVKEGAYMKLRVDNFSYGGEATANNPFGEADNWISFHVWSQAPIAPGSLEYGSGWLSLVRHNNGGAIAAQSFVNKPTDASFVGGHKGDVNITPEVDADGNEIYTFGISYDGTNYNISICGVAVMGTADITALLNELDPDGNFYIGVTFHSGVSGGVAQATILEYGTSAEDAEVPTGSDSKETDENVLWVADMADSSTIAEGQPALIFDANRTSWKGNIPVDSMQLEEQGDGSFKVNAANAVGSYTWSVARDYSYQATDFPVVTMLIHDPNQIFTDGVLRYCAGKNMTADNVHVLNFSIYDDGCSIYGVDEDVYLIVLDMKTLLTTENDDGTVDTSAFDEGWTGRINALRFDTNTLGYDAEYPEENFYYLHYAGIFRTVEDAQAYGEAYVEKTWSGATQVTEGEETDAPAPETGDAAEDTGAVDGTTADGTGAEAGTNAEAGTDATTAEGGCASVVGFGAAAVLMAAAAAAVVLKEKD